MFITVLTGREQFHRKRWLDMDSKTSHHRKRKTSYNSIMNFNDYQAKIANYDLSDINQWNKNLSSPCFMEKVLGLAGEAGEVTDKIKKIIRDQNGQLTKEDHTAIAKELGDTLWYLTTIARYLDIPLDDIATTNINKLQSRLERHKISGSGDNR